MIYADDPTIKDMLRRIEYLEKKVKEINIRTLPINDEPPSVPGKNASPLLEQTTQEPATMREILGAALRKPRMPPEDPVQSQD